ncbi:DgyrCDS12413 [Dimorphilus gyrociliatus]|uniref:DgyrCDS12413 n=1 Tax=Dimorphilus gyrociliatus TaxID=2664684 RepID=A0A7I8W6D5_9ANNE|nr:DgyrCDS12413 [Dimorphilus gyrociliatus]
MSETICLRRPSSDVPWGFRLKGGRDYQCPIIVQRVTVGSIAGTGLSVGDIITKIGSYDTANLNLNETQELIKCSGNLLQLNVIRTGQSGQQYHPQQQYYQQQPQQQYQPYEQQNFQQAYYSPQEQVDPYQNSYYSSQYNQSSDCYGGQNYTGGYSSPTPQNQRYEQPAYNRYPSYQSSGTFSPSSEISNQQGMSQTSDRTYSPIRSVQAPISPVTENPPSHYNQYGAPIQQNRTFSPVSSIQSPPSTPNQLNYGTNQMQAPFGGSPRYLRQTSSDFNAKPKPFGFNQAAVSSSTSELSDNSEAPAITNTRLEQQLENIQKFGSLPKPVMTNMTELEKPKDKPKSPISDNRVQHKIPDAILNMAASKGSDKKPWSYAPDLDVIKQQREKVRKRGSTIPRYQNILNLPAFDDDNNTNNTSVPQTDNNLQGLPGTKNSPSDSEKSPVFKMIHGLEEPKKNINNRPNRQHSYERSPREPAPDDELRFTGLNSGSRKEEPRGEVDESSLFAYRSHDRYTGGNIPSRSFKILQSITGTEDDVSDSTPTYRKNVKKHDEEENIPQYEPTVYSGGHIPSRSFKILQQSYPKHELESNTNVQVESQLTTNLPTSQPINQPTNQPMNQVGEDAKTGAGTNHFAQPTIEQPPAPTGTRRRRQRPPEKQRLFNEQAFLAGKIPIVHGGNVDPKVIEYYESQTNNNTVSNSLEEGDKPHLKTDFDEKAFLAGKVPIISGEGENQPAGFNKPEKIKEKAPWQREEINPVVTTDDFDEKEFLKGGRGTVRQSVDRELASTPVFERTAYTRNKAPWERRFRDDGTVSDAEFDESRFIRRRQRGSNKENAVNSEFYRTSRSISKERFLQNDEYERGCRTDDEDSPRRRLVYTGSKIPSKYFKKLQLKMWDSPDNPTAPKPPVNITQKVNDKEVKSEEGQLKNNTEMVNGEIEVNKEEEEKKETITKEPEQFEGKEISEPVPNGTYEQVEESKEPIPNGTCEKVEEFKEPVELPVEN